jgi:hypothetical protein
MQKDLGPVLTDFALAILVEALMGVEANIKDHKGKSKPIAN